MTDNKDVAWMGQTCSKTTQPEGGTAGVGAVPQRPPPPPSARFSHKNPSGHPRAVRQAPLPILGTRLVRSCSHIPAQFLGRDQSGFQVQCQRVCDRTRVMRGLMCSHQSRDLPASFSSASPATELLADQDGTAVRLW